MMNRIRFHLYLFLLIAVWVPGAISCSRRTAAQLVQDGFGQGNGSKAIQLYSKAIKKDSTCVEAYWRRADVQAKIGRYTKAITDLDRTIHFDSAFNAGYLFGDRGNVEETMGEWEKAVADYTIALRFSTRVPPYTPTENFFFYRARTKLCLGDTASALADTDSALYYWPTFPRARFQRARIETIRGEYAKATSDYCYYQDVPITPDMASGREFVADVFYYGLLKYKLTDSLYCSYWKAAARYHYPIAMEYVKQCCKP
jgi:tetratricopeptide (TPR) repeat protein